MGSSHGSQAAHVAQVPQLSASVKEEQAQSGAVSPLLTCLWRQPTTALSYTSPASPLLRGQVDPEVWSKELRWGGSFSGAW